MEVFKQNGGLIDVLSDAISEGIIVVNDKQIIVATNKATDELFGYAQEALVGKPLYTLIPRKYHPDHGAISKSSWAKARNVKWEVGEIYMVCDRMVWNFQLKLVLTLLRSTVPPM